MNRETARSLALEELTRFQPEVGVPLMLLEHKTIEKRLGWVFFYDTREFVETGDFSSSLAGNGPIVVWKDGAHTTSYGAHPPVTEILAGLE